MSLVGVVGVVLRGVGYDRREREVLWDVDRGLRSRGISCSLIVIRISLLSTFLFFSVVKECSFRILKGVVANARQ